jgi:hypothetical protein
LLHFELVSIVQVNVHVESRRFVTVGKSISDLGLWKKPYKLRENVVSFPCVRQGLKVNGVPLTFLAGLPPNLSVASEHQG